ncbi:hypothetical protein BDY17DRAFT_294589 [Neohortaea acidophila]|uniref:Uncharacterized protein n=1 Tax=Neohortaea acidophila TaxID=245834 RepID=A0A6A6PVW8_9PEZI|nr:uncharacterized protein BDY17DRAFT_294589 [Neohortaea acidophila]KAF2483881.1 hypothetical protein BDY17DRAFT_294589 [Neohortaea acidophila]
MLHLVHGRSHARPKDVMFALRAFGRCTPRRIPSVLVLATRCPRPSTPSLLPKCRPSVFIPGRYAQTATNRPGEKYAYPENLNVFDGGLFNTYTIGFTRVATLAIAAYGTLWALPSVIIAGGVPWYVYPAYATLPWLPWLATGIFFGGYVSHINVLLPRAARRSKAELIHFARSIPPTTTLQIKSLWFRPWPHSREVQFGNLRRLPKSWTRLTNLELQPSWTASNRAIARKHRVYDYIARTVMGRFYVVRDRRRETARVSGMWDQMWEQIPVIGEEGGTEKLVGSSSASPASLPATAKNRRVPVSRARR